MPRSFFSLVAEALDQGYVAPGDGDEGRDHWIKEAREAVTSHLDDLETAREGDI